MCRELSAHRAEVAGGGEAISAILLQADGVKGKGGIKGGKMLPQPLSHFRLQKRFI